MIECKWIIRSVDKYVSTNARYGLVMNNKGCFEPIDTNNVEHIKFFDSEKKARKACKNLTNVSVDFFFVESQMISKNWFRKFMEKVVGVK